MTQASIVCFPKSLFASTLITNAKNYLEGDNFPVEDGGVTYILQSFDYASCRITSRTLIKCFDDRKIQNFEDDTDEEDKDQDQFDGSHGKVFGNSGNILENNSMVFFEKETSQAEEQLNKSISKD